VSLAAATLGAGVEVEHVLPAEVLQGRRAEVLICLVLRIHDRLEVEDRQCALRPGVLEEDVRRRGGDVQVLAVAQVHEESEDQHQVRPKEDPVQDGERIAARPERGEKARERAGERPVGRKRLRRAALGDQRGVVEFHEGDQRADPRQDQHRVSAMAAPEPGGVHHQPVDQSHEHAGEDGDAEDVLGERDDRGTGHPVEHERLPQRLDDRLGDGGEEHEESPEDQGVEHARVRPAKQTPLGHDVDAERLEAATDVVEPGVRARTAAHRTEQPPPAQSRCHRGGAGQQDQADRAEDRGHPSAPSTTAPHLQERGVALIAARPRLG
jgi:hypothetical protein